MADWAINVDGSCDVLQDLDITTAKVVKMNKDVRIFVNVIGNPTEPKQVITWGEKKDIGIFVSARDAPHIVKRRPRETCRILRIQMPKKDGLGATTLSVNARMKSLSLSKKKTASLEKLGYTYFKKAQGEQGETIWIVVPPAAEKQ